MAKEKKGPEMPSAPSYMLTYGDMMTLLLCFFVLLFSMSSIDVSKYSKVIGAFEGSTSFFVAGPGFVGDSPDGGAKNSQATKSKNKNQMTQSASKVSKKNIEKELKQISTGIDNAQAKFEIIRNKQGTILRLNNTLLFDTGRAKLKKSALPILSEIADVLKQTNKKVIVEGHTDNVPIGPSLRKRYPTNWELSTARATNVLRYFVEVKNLNPNNFSASGYGEYRPIADNNTEAGRRKNRRVDIVILDENPK
jgi:chemotaxis protein MotB